MNHAFDWVSLVAKACHLFPCMEHWNYWNQPSGFLNNYVIFQCFIIMTHTHTRTRTRTRVRPCHFFYVAEDQISCIWLQENKPLSPRMTPETLHTYRCSGRADITFPLAPSQALCLLIVLTDREEKRKRKTKNDPLLTWVEFGNLIPRALQFLVALILAACVSIVPKCALLLDESIC